MKKDFWHKSPLTILGGGSWGTVLAQLAAPNVSEVRLWVRNEDLCRSINATRMNPKYVPGLTLHERIRASSDLSAALDSAKAVIWALPSPGSRSVSREAARFLTGEEIVIHATKGVEESTLKRISEVLLDELPCPRIGVVSGPNLALEIARGEPTAAIVASAFDEVLEAGSLILSGRQFRVYRSHDVIGVEWAGTLKNILAIASGCLEALGLGANSRAFLLSRGLAEMVRFGKAMGAQVETFLGLAGMGDLLATCSSPLSRNFQVGFQLAKGGHLGDIITKLGSTAEGIGTAQIIHDFAKSREIEMPITEGVAALIRGQKTVTQVIDALMSRPTLDEFL